MQELSFIRQLATIIAIAKRAGADPADWSMALEPSVLSFFDGILSGIHGHLSYHLVEDLIDEVLEHLAAREPAFESRFAADPVFEDLHYPFGHRIDMGRALKARRLLMRARPAAGRGKQTL